MLINLSNQIGSSVASNLNNQTLKYALLIDSTSFILDVYCLRHAKQPISEIIKKKDFIVIEYMVQRCLYSIEDILPSNTQYEVKVNYNDSNSLLVQIFVCDLVDIYYMLLEKYKNIWYYAAYQIGLYQTCQYNSYKMLDALFKIHQSDNYFDSIVKKRYIDLCSVAVQYGSGTTFKILCNYIHDIINSSFKWEKNLIRNNIFSSIVSYIYLKIPFKCDRGKYVCDQYNLILETYLDIFLNIDCCINGCINDFFDNVKGVYLLIRLIAFDNSSDILENIINKYRSLHDLILDDEDIIAGILFSFNCDAKNKQMYSKAIEAYWRKFKSNKYMNNNIENNINKIAIDYTKFINNISNN